MLAPIKYFPSFIPTPNEYFQRLKEGLNWERRDAPRNEYYCNDFDRPYIYGRGRGERQYFPRPYNKDILDIRKKLEELTNVVFEVCFLNRYLNKKDQLGWHADDSPEMDDLRPIGVVSLGAEREIWLRKNDKSIVEKLKLENGSLCLMAPGMQDEWKHRIPKASYECGERISLTYRGYVALPKPEDSSPEVQEILDILDKIKYKSK